MKKKGKYRKNFKYWDMYVRATSVDSDQTALKEQSDQDLHCLPFFLHLLEALLQCKIKLFHIKDNYGRVLARNFKTCVRDSLLGANWRPRMKNMRTGIRI